MLYKLNEEDIFRRDKIATMINLLARIIEFAEKYDSTREFINEDWLETIKERHDRYFRLLSKIDETIIDKDKSLHSKIVALKIEKPCEKIDVLSELCNVDKSRVSRHLKDFVDDVKIYLD